MLQYKLFCFNLCCFFFLAFNAKAFTIEGKIVDAATHKSILAADVFINGTTKYSESDSNGNFQLNASDEYYSDLIVAAKGYNYVAYRVSKDSSNQKIVFQLTPLTPDNLFIQPDSIATKNYTLFKPVLEKWLLSNQLVEGYNSLINPTVLRFEYDSTSSSVTVKTVDKLFFLNEFLGYMAVIYINNLTISSNIIQFNGFYYFKPLSYKNDNAKRDRDYRRLNVYKGSLLHFIRSLYDEKLAINGFSLHKVDHVFEGTELYKSVSKKYGEYLEQPKLLNSALRIPSNLKYIDMLNKQNIIEQDILEKNRGLHEIFFASDDIFQVSYQAASFNWQPQESYISLLSTRKLRIESNGMYFEPTDLVIDGFWRTTTFDTILPFDYFPPLELMNNLF